MLNTNFHQRCSQKKVKKISKVLQKRFTKKALGTGGALSTARPLGNSVRPLGVAPLDDFLNTPLREPHPKLPFSLELLCVGLVFERF